MGWKLLRRLETAAATGTVALVVAGVYKNVSSALSAELSSAVCLDFEFFFASFFVTATRGSLRQGSRLCQIMVKGRLNAWLVS